ncbi:rhodanese-like domain-containing protein 4A, chloroplastic isoform X1 [Pistacia vera]|uniref:rhodanese-like domain-containing protein 4A, chloroplastic isoform X1 n=1 Tax=Pistacia vera TaxID=55513 RepID=UPI001263DF2E|nr:rhodanese-like domain-containing protein 4A, chloroplastic isoform X1 [Pistacia vera]
MLIMESLSLLLSSSPPLQNHPRTLKSTSSKSTSILPNSLSLSSSSTHSSTTQINDLSLLKTLTKTHLSFTIVDLFTSLPCLAAETVVSSTEPASDKINLESILISIDDFFNRYPFFVATCTFIWLFVIPLTQQYLSKYKLVSAIDAFRKLRDDPNAQLLDIRNTKTLVSLGSPNLKSLSKSVVQVQFTEGDEDGFVKNVLDNFADPANTVLCIMDNFEGNSLTAAELLFKNGFKEAYAIKGGVRGKQGWLEIQDTLLPPSVHIIPRKKKKVKVSQKLGINGVNQQSGDKKEDSSSVSVAIVQSQMENNVHLNNSTNIKIGSRSSSFYQITQI